MTPEFLAGLSAVCAIAAVSGAVLAMCAMLDANDHRENARAACEEARAAADLAVESVAAKAANTTKRVHAWPFTDPLQAKAVEPLPEEPPPAGPKRRGRASLVRAYFDRGGIADLYRDHGNPVG